MQPVHRRAVCDGLPDRGDVQAARRHRRLRQGDLHRLQGVHGGLPIRRDLHQPRRPLGREVQHVRPSNRRGSRARLRLGVPNGSDHRRRRQRPDIQGGATRGAPPRRRFDGRRRRPGRVSSTSARTRPPSTHSDLPAPRAASTPGPPRARPTLNSSPQATRRGPGRRLPHCFPTTSPTMRHGAGGSASTRGPRASPQAHSCWPRCWR